MPHLVICNRYWRLAGDELPIPAFCAVVGRVIQLTVASLLLKLSEGDMLYCHSDLTVYVVISILMILISIGMELLIIYSGLQGTIVEISKRRTNLEYFLTGHSLIAFMGVGLAIWGTFILSKFYHVPCASAVVDHNYTGYVLLFLVALSQYIDSLSQFFCCYLFSSKRAGREESDSLLNPDLENNLHSPTSDETDDEDFNSHNQKIWAKRCQALCSCTRFFSCGIFGGANVTQDIDAVARVLTKLFHHEGFLDVVPSDVLAGILLVRLQQRDTWKRFHEFTGKLESRNFDTDAVTRQAFYENPLPPRTQIVLNARRRNMNHLNAEDSSDVKTVSRLSHFAFAIYTHLLYLYAKPATGMCNLCYTCGCGHENSANQSHLGDNCFHMNQAAAETVINQLGNAEIIYASYENDNVMKPYGIFLDHETEKVVIAIRGTLSLEDCITDAICDPTELKEAGEKWGFDGDGKWVHAGMLRSALAIRDDIDRRGILSGIFSSSNSGESRNYGITFVGHSLGAGTAVLLSLLFQNIYPNLKCVAFGTPGSLVDKECAELFKDTVLSVVLDDDIIPRLGVPTINNIRHQVLESIPRSKCNKSYIMRTLFRDSTPDEYMYRSGEEPPSRFKDAVDKFLTEMKNRNEVVSADRELVIPGRIIHLVKNDAQKNREDYVCTSLVSSICCCQCKSKSYDVQEVSADVFAEIVISPSMALDHFPTTYVRELSRLNDDWHRFSDI